MKTVAKVTRQTLLLVYLLIFMPLHRRWRPKIVPTCCMCVSPTFAKNRSSHVYKNLPTLKGRVDVDEYYPRQLNAFFYNKLVYTSKLIVYGCRRTVLPPWTRTPSRSCITFRTPITHRLTSNKGIDDNINDDSKPYLRFRLMTDKSQ